MKRKADTATVASTTAQADSALPSLVSPVPTGDNAGTIIFPEWSDDEVNSEKWEQPSAKLSAQAKKSGLVESTQSTNLSTVDQFDESGLYVDPHIVRCPSSVSPMNWVRPDAIFPEAKLVIYRDTHDYIDLLSCNRHLLKSVFFRSFISAIGILEYLSYYSPWTMESQTGRYSPSTINSPWKPWHHIYSQCKAGKGQTHLPLVNQAGKYYVRLHWMGLWRRIIIDDTIPVDESNTILLPITSKSPDTGAHVTVKERDSKGKNLASVKEEPIELWPLILSKALLKLACLTWSTDDEVCGFDVISALTGWTMQNICTTQLDLVDVWDMCRAYSQNYVWPEDKVVEPLDKAVHKKEAVKGKSTTKSDTRSGSSSKLKSSITSISLKKAPYHLVGNLSNTELNKWPSHQLLIDQTRNVPLEKPKEKPPLENWKKFRWVDWACRQGLYEPDIDTSTMRFIKFVSNFRANAEFVKFMDYVKDKNSGQSKTSGTVLIPHELKNPAPSASEKSAKANSRSTKTKITTMTSLAKIITPPDPSMWCDFNKIHKFLHGLNIYLQPCEFVSNVIVSNLADANKLDVRDNKSVATVKKSSLTGTLVQETNSVVWYKHLLPKHNEPIYVFIESIDTQFIAFELNQTGDLEQLFNADKECFIPESHLVVEEYDWKSEVINDQGPTLSTRSAKTVLLNLNPGRHVLRLWIRSENSFVVRILSDAQIKVGNLEATIGFMTNESMLFIGLYNGICDSFGKLIMSLGTPSYPQMLRQFYMSYKPVDHDLSKLQIAVIHEEFMTEFMSYLQDYYAIKYPEMQHALKVLFLNPNLGPYIAPGLAKTKKSVYKNFAKRKSRSRVDSAQQSLTDLTETNIRISMDVGDIKKLENGAVIIQAFFKRILVRILKGLQKQEHKHHMKVFTDLKNIYDTICSADKRPEHCQNILRKLFFFNDGMSALRNYYTVYKDLEDVLDVQTFQGRGQQSSTNWVPLCRINFFVNAQEAVLIKITMFSNIPNHVTRVFDNDSKQEVVGMINNVPTIKYAPNRQGYTIVSYGWNTTEKNVFWKLTLAFTRKTTDKDRPLISAEETECRKDIIWDQYKPRSDGELFKFKIVASVDNSATFRLSTSSENAYFHLKCFNATTNKAVDEIIGKGHLIMPLVVFDAERRKSSVELESRKSIPSKMSSNQSGKNTRRRHRTGSVSSRKSSILAIETKPDVSYVLKGYVLNDTWAMDSSEWSIVKDLKKRNALGSNFIKSLEPSTNVEDVVNKLGSLGKVDSLSSRKSKQMTRPFWCIEVVYNKNMNLYMLRDKQEDNKIKIMKAKWYQNDKTRYDRCLKARNEFLGRLAKETTDHTLFPGIQQVLKLPSKESLISGESVDSKKLNFQEYSIMLSERRSASLKSRQSTCQDELHSYEIALEKSINDLKYLESQIKSNSDIAEENLHRELMIEDFACDWMFYTDDMKKLLKEQIGRNVDIEEWYGKLRERSAIMMEDAVKKRQDFVNKFCVDLPTKEVKDKPAKEKKVKGSKKGG